LHINQHDKCINVTLEGDNPVGSRLRLELAVCQEVGMRLKGGMDPETCLWVVARNCHKY
jgi:hypothetical protein